MSFILKDPLVASKMLSDSVPVQEAFAALLHSLQGEEPCGEYEDGHLYAISAALVEELKTRHKMSTKAATDAARAISERQRGAIQHKRNGKNVRRLKVDMDLFRKFCEVQGYEPEYIESLLTALNS